MTKDTSDVIDVTELTVEQVQDGFARGTFTSETLTKAARMPTACRDEMADMKVWAQRS